MKLPKPSNVSLIRFYQMVFTATLASLVTVYLVSPGTPQAQLIMATEVALAVGLTIGYMVGAQLPDPLEREQRSLDP